MVNQETIRERANAELQKIVDLFSTTELPTVIKKIMIEESGKPSDNWSLGNRIIALIHETIDARTYNQWREVGRYPKKGSHGFYIIAPNIFQITEKVKDKKTGKETGETQNRTIMAGFKIMPYAEFRFEDTEGKALPEPEHKPKQFPPLVDVARKLGANVRYAESLFGEFASFNPRTQEITLCTPDQSEFFHELAHLAHQKLDGDKVKVGQHPEQEAIAELTAAVLSQLYGKDIKSEAWTYIRHYTQGKTKEDVGKLCFSVLSKVEKILDLILENVQVIEVVA